MAFKQTHGTLRGDISRTTKSTTVPENSNGCFDCNICLDSSHDPVVTLCGHLYCWSCIYKWLQVQHSSVESNDQSKCPVCKNTISTSSLIPLYGRGMSISNSEAKKPRRDLTLPLRSQLLRTNTSSTYDQNDQIPLHRPQYVSHPLHSYHTSSMVSPTTLGGFSPTIYMVGEMVFARMFGSSDTGLFGYPFSGSNNNSPRMRRREMQLDKSLNRVSVFLFCCIVLCLILF